MRNLNILFFLSLLSVSLSAQENITSDGAESITIEELRDHMFFLASDEMEGRLTGTQGYDKAVQYAATQFREAGLSPICRINDSTFSFYQGFSLEKCTPGLNSTISISKVSESRNFKFEENFIILYGGPFDVKELKGGLVFVGSGLREPDSGIDDYKNVNVKGKWAVMVETIPDNVKKELPEQILQKYLYRPENERLRVQYATDAGAIGLILISGSSDINGWKRMAGAYRDFYTIPGIGQPWFNTKLPSVRIDSLMFEYLFSGQKYNPIDKKKRCKSFVLDNCELTLHKEFHCSNVYSSNAIGLIEGADPVLRDEYIVVTAHLDHMGIEDGEVMNGANDDASGSVGVLEIAEALVKLKPERSIICILCAGEEEGLLGSYFFTENPIVPLDNIIANINIDMIGCSNTEVKGLAPIGAGRITPRLKELISQVSYRINYIPINWEYADTCRFINSSDHYPFHLKKIPAVFFFGGGNSDTHSPSDDPEKIDYDFLQKSCSFICEVIKELANGTESLKNYPLKNTSVSKQNHAKEVSE